MKKVHRSLSKRKMEDYRIERVLAGIMISCDVGKRGKKIHELVIRNY